MRLTSGGTLQSAHRRYESASTFFVVVSVHSGFCVEKNASLRGRIVVGGTKKLSGLSRNMAAAGLPLMIPAIGLPSKISALGLVLENAAGSMVRTLFGMRNMPSERQPAKAKASMFEMPGGISTRQRFRQ